jgi:hypothetical protein
VAGKSAGSAEVMLVRALTPPADAPMSMSFCISDPPYGLMLGARRFFCCSLTHINTLELSNDRKISTV